MDKQVGAMHGTRPNGDADARPGAPCLLPLGKARPHQRTSNSKQAASAFYPHRTYMGHGFCLPLFGEQLCDGAVPSRNGIRSLAIASASAKHWPHVHPPCRSACVVSGNLKYYQCSCLRSTCFVFLSVAAAASFRLREQVVDNNKGGEGIAASRKPP